MPRLPLTAVRWTRPLADEIEGRRVLSGARAVIAAFEHLVRPLLHALDPEDAHALTIKHAEIRAGAARLRATTRGSRCAPSG